jgi:hypothetical protein
VRSGYVKSNTVMREETPLQREVCWRYLCADAMVAAAALKPAAAS